MDIPIEDHKEQNQLKDGLKAMEVGDHGWKMTQLVYD